MFYHLWPTPTLAKPPNPTPTLAKLRLANTNFGQTKFGQHHILVFEVGWAGSGGRWSGSGPRKGEWIRRGNAPAKVGNPKGGGPKVGPRSVEASKGGGPEGWGRKPGKSEGLEGWGAQHFALFSFSRHNFLSFFPLLGSSRGILVVFVAPGPLKCARLDSRAVV